MAVRLRSARTSISPPYDSATDGIGEREERLSGEDGIDPAQVYIVRVGRK